MQITFALLFVTSYVNGFLKPVSLSRQTKYLKSPLKMDLNKDMDMIHKFKDNFRHEDFNQIISDLNAGKIKEILVNSDYKQVVTVDNLPEDYFTYHHYQLADINPLVLPTLIQKSTDWHVPIYFVNFTPESIVGIQDLASNIISVISYFLPIFLIASLIASFVNVRNVASGKGAGKPFDMFLSGKNKEDFGKQNVSLSSWAGSPEVVEECREIISYLENKELYKKVGAVMPKGFLLEGPPGTGKTLLAKAIATETNSTFISKSGSEFVELFVGMGAAKVRELFEKARQNTPAIIFIDEIDAVGKQRSASTFAANDEREQTLNQILYEMDGFNNNDDIVVMAATNRKDILDKALLRPGRFDRIIRIPLPDLDSREKILQVYLKDKEVSKEIDISAVAELTDGFSGAELKNLVNEAAIMTVKNNQTVIQEQYIFDSFEKSIVGLIRRNATTSSVTNQRVAIHEIGHTLLTLEYPEYFDFQKVSIRPTYNGAGGYTLFTEKSDIKEGGLYTKDMLKKRLIVSLGGKAAESIYYGDEFVSLGAIQDLKQANSLAKKMVGQFGMGEELEVFYNEGLDELNAGRDLYSDDTKMKLDRESLDLVKNSYIEAKRILRQRKDEMIYWTEELKDRFVLYKKDF
jgi:cell division protease FtsH